MVVWLANSSTIMLSWVGSRCWTKMKAMTLLTRRLSTSFLHVSRPPADAPIPTIRKSSRPCGGPRTGAAAPSDRARVGLAWGGRLLGILCGPPPEMLPRGTGCSRLSQALYRRDSGQETWLAEQAACVV